LEGDTHAIYSRISVAKQREVKLLVFLTLGTSVGVALVIALRPFIPLLFSLLLLVLLFVIGISSQVTMQVFHTEDQWFQARAVAETAKSLGWEYMMRSARLRNREYPLKTDSGEQSPLEEDKRAELVTMQILRDLRGEFKSSLSPKWDDLSTSTEISSEMRRIRASPLEERRSIYLDKRVDNQIRWYERKARANRIRSRQFAAATILIQIIGLGTAIYVFTLQLTTWEELLPLFATLVASIVGWAQSRRYAELVEPYTYASETLKDLKGRITQAANEASFGELVEVSERAISREHQMWQIRRGVTPRKHLGIDEGNTQ
jgi:hypothetical protein